VSDVVSETQKKLISVAIPLMLRQGYSATGIDSICGEAGVSKGAFYHSFRSKEELAIAALESFFQRGLEQLRSIDVGDAPPVERLPLFVERLADRAEMLWENGCLIGGLATEMALANDELQGHLARHLDGLVEFVVPLAEPYANALSLSGVSPRSLAEDLLAFIEGIVVVARSHRDPGLLRPALRRFATLLRAALGTPRAVSARSHRR
jgi:TetR/AcrR family transcriptional repressor of nem operon